MSLRLGDKTIAGVGKDGKTAYQFAVDGGFEGTEEEFMRLVARVIYSGTEEPSTAIGKDGDIYVKYNN